MKILLLFFCFLNICLAESPAIVKVPKDPAKIAQEAEIKKENAERVETIKKENASQRNEFYRREEQTRRDRFYIRREIQTEKRIRAIEKKK